MRIPIALKIAALTVVATVFYTYVGQLVPQKEVHPPEVTELSAEMTTADLVEVGKEIFEGKGMCSTCHTIGQSGALRFPDMAGIATRAEERVEGLSALEYMAQSLYEPEAFIVSGFTGGMPPVDRPPVGLTDEEIRTVLAYLQTLGGEATITVDTAIPFSADAEAAPAEMAAEDSAEAGEAAEEAQATAAAAASVAGPTACETCHVAGSEAGALAEVISGLNRSGIIGAVAAHPPVEGTDFGSLTLTETGEIARSLAEGGVP